MQNPCVQYASDNDASMTRVRCQLISKIFLILKIFSLLKRICEHPQHMAWLTKTLIGFLLKLSSVRWLYSHTLSPLCNSISTNQGNNKNIHSTPATVTCETVSQLFTIYQNKYKGTPCIPAALRHPAAVSIRWTCLPIPEQCNTNHSRMTHLRERDRIYKRNVFPEEHGPVREAGGGRRQLHWRGRTVGADGGAASPPSAPGRTRQPGGWWWLWWWMGRWLDSCLKTRWRRRWTRKRMLQQTIKSQFTMCHVNNISSIKQTCEQLFLLTEFVSF